MENIYMIVLFLVPGLIFHAIDRKVFMKSREEYEFYDYVFDLVIHSVVISIITLTIIKCAICILNLGYDISSFTNIAVSMDSLKFTLMYVLVMGAVSVAWWNAYNRLIKSKINKIFTKTIKKITGNIFTGYESVYDGILANEEYTTHLMPVTIIQNGEKVTSGTLSSYNTSNQKKREFKIENQEEIKQILEKDKYLDKEDKILPYIDFEYYSPEDGLLIRFYRPSRLEKYWSELYKDNN